MRPSGRLPSENSTHRKPTLLSGTLFSGTLNSSTLNSGNFDNGTLLFSASVLELVSKLHARALKIEAHGVGILTIGIELLTNLGDHKS